MQQRRCQPLAQARALQTGVQVDILNKYSWHMIYRLHPFRRQTLYWDEIHSASHQFNEPWSMSFITFSPLLLLQGINFLSFHACSPQYEPMHPSSMVSKFIKRQNLWPAGNSGISTLWLLSTSVGLSDDSVVSELSSILQQALVNGSACFGDASPPQTGRCSTKL